MTTEYTLNGSQILREKTGDKVLNYYYDGNGCLASMGYVNGSAEEKLYTFTRNAQGDIVGVYECVPYQSSGIVTYRLKLVGTYSYDAWGNIIAVTPASARSDPDRILQKNPFRYRGYYYDTETGFYYLQSRYYDPAVRRFINADEYISTGQGFVGSNMFAYCGNNPVNMFDKDGHDAGTLAAEWAAGMWWLTLVDGPLPIGDAIYAAGAAVLTVAVVVEGTKKTDKAKTKSVAKASGKSNPRDLEKGMTKNQKSKFQREIEMYKKENGMPPNYNLPWEILVMLAEEVKKMYK